MCNDATKCMRSPYPVVSIGLDIKLLEINLLTQSCIPVGNFTTNLAECWMSIRAKFDGGKQYNRSQSGAWEGRCAGAGLRQNYGPGWGTVAWEKATGTEANPVFMTYTKNYTREVERNRKHKASEEVKQRRSARKYRKTNDDSLQARHDYARHDDGPGVLDVNHDVPGDYLQGLMMD